jgi:predicted DCC family thiol-disulfide oxidoreductase YuxK
MAAVADWIFYDGSCGLCHRWVKFVIARDHDGRLFHFAPLQGDRYRRSIHTNSNGHQPDSIVVLTASGRTLTRSSAAVYILRRLGGAWAAIGLLLHAIPRPVRDAGYDFVARIRYKLFDRPEASCPMLPAELRKRFDT